MYPDRLLWLSAQTVEQKVPSIFLLCTECSSTCVIILERSRRLLTNSVLRSFITETCDLLKLPLTGSIHRSWLKKKEKSIWIHSTHWSLNSRKTMWGGFDEDSSGVSVIVCARMSPVCLEMRNAPVCSEWWSKIWSFTQLQRKGRGMTWNTNYITRRRLHCLIWFNYSHFPEESRRHWSSCRCYLQHQECNYSAGHY